MLSMRPAHVPAAVRSHENSIRLARRAAAATVTVSVGVAALLSTWPHAALAPAPLRQALAPERLLRAEPVGLQALASAAIGAREPAYHLRPTRDGWQAGGSGGGLSAHFAGGRATIHTGASDVVLTLVGLRAGRTLEKLGPPREENASANRFSYTSGRVRGWYANGPQGIEQGFTVADAPHGGGSLALMLAVGGATASSLAPGGRSVLLDTPRGPALRYGALSVTDAHGRSLPARLGARGQELLLQVDTRGAAYPIVIDPFIQQAGPLLDEGSGIGRQRLIGEDVAISADGNTALVSGGGWGWVFTRTGTQWAQQAVLAGTGTECGILTSDHVALSADGNTAIIGSPNSCPPTPNEYNAGAAWIFARSGGTWTQQAGPYVGNEEDEKVGLSVALSGDGNTAMIRDQAGLVTVLERSGTTWSQQSTIQAGADRQPAGEFVGYSPWWNSLALSGDGSVALIGEPEANEHSGTARVYARTGGGWALQQELSGSGEAGEGRFGFSVALSPQGDVALVGAPYDNSRVGAAWAFTRSGATWSGLGGKLTSGEGGEQQFGFGVSLPDDGVEAALVTAGATGVPWMFYLNGAKEALAGGLRGRSAISADGTTVLAGDDVPINFPEYFGQAFVFYNGGGAPYVNAVSPTSGPDTGGTKVRIEGTGLVHASAVDFGATPAASFTVVSEKLIEAPAPAGSGKVDVRVTSPAGTSPVTSGDQYTFVPYPRVTHIEPGEGPATGGTTVTLEGADLSGASVVQFGGSNAGFTVESANRISAVAPPGHGTVDVTVTTGYGTSATSPADRFSYVAAPTISKISPNKGEAAGGQPVTITGTNFTGASVVRFGSVTATGASVKSQTEIVVPAPAHTSEAVDVTVTTSGGTSATSKKDMFKYGKPTVTGVSPAAGALGGGTAVTITGSGFALGSSTVFLFGKAQAVGVACSSPGSCTATSPPGAKAGVVNVIAEVGKAKSKKSPPGDEFNYE